jgi:hypothetical protein
MWQKDQCLSAGTEAGRANELSTAGMSESRQAASRSTWGEHKVFHSANSVLSFFFFFYDAGTQTFIYARETFHGGATPPAPQLFLFLLIYLFCSTGGLNSEP